MGADYCKGLATCRILRPTIRLAPLLDYSLFSCSPILVIVVELVGNLELPIVVPTRAPCYVYNLLKPPTLLFYVCGAHSPPIK